MELIRNGYEVIENADEAAKEVANNNRAFNRITKWGVTILVVLAALGGFFTFWKFHVKSFSQVKSPEFNCAACTFSECVSGDHYHKQPNYFIEVIFISETKILGQCGVEEPYLCLTGAAANGCTIGSNGWQSSNLCSECCDMSNCASTIAAGAVNHGACNNCSPSQCQLLSEISTQTCGSAAPYICVSGSARFVSLTNFHVS